MKVLKFIKPAIFGAAMLCSFASYGQGPGFLPLGFMPMQYNSSFAGGCEEARFSTAFSYGRGRSSGSQFSKSQELNYHASYDQFIPALRSGIGVSVYRSTEAYIFDYISTVNGWRETSHESKSYFNGASLAIAPKISIKGKYTISPSIDFSYGRGQAESIYPKEQNRYDRSGTHEQYTSRVGLLFNTQKYYIGYSAYLLYQSIHNKQRIDSYQGKFVSILQAGYTFQKNTESKFSFTPQVAVEIGTWQASGKFGLLNASANLSFRYDKLIAGVNLVGLHLGWQTEKLRVLIGNNPFDDSDEFYENGILAFRYILKD